MLLTSLEGNSRTILERISFLRLSFTRFFFSSLGFRFSEFQNPADFLVKNLAIMPGKEDDSAIQSLDICKKFDSSEHAQEMYDFMVENTLDEVSKLTPELPYIDDAHRSNIVHFFVAGSRIPCSSKNVRISDESAHPNIKCGIETVKEKCLCKTDRF